MSCPLVWALQPCYSFSASTLTTKRLWFDTRKSSLSSFSLFFSFISILRLRARPPARFSGSRAPVPRSSGPGWRAWSSSPRRPATNKALEKVLIYCYIFQKQRFYNQTELNNVSWEVNCMTDEQNILTKCLSWHNMHSKDNTVSVTLNFHLPGTRSRPPAVASLSAITPCIWDCSWICLFGKQCGYSITQKCSAFRSTFVVTKSWQSEDRKDALHGKFTTD